MTLTDPTAGRSSDAQAAGAYSGRLDGAALADRLAFDAAHPLSSHEMQNWARCAFRGLSAQVIGLEGAQSAGEDLDARVRGSLWHEALAVAVPRLRDAKLLGRPSAEARALVEAAVDGAAEKLAERNAVGHPALWALARDWAVRVITTVVTSEKVSKAFQLAKESRMRRAGGRYLAHPATGDRLRIPAEVKTTVIRLP